MTQANKRAEWYVCVCVHVLYTMTPSGINPPPGAMSSLASSS